MLKGEEELFELILCRFLNPSNPLINNDICNRYIHFSKTVSKFNGLFVCFLSFLCIIVDKLTHLEASP